MPWTPTKRPSRPVSYTPDPPWDDGAHCTGEQLPAVRALGSALMDRFPVILQAQGYNCRPNSALPSRMSVHGTGRAIDLMMPRGDTRGDEIGDWLIEHAAELGIQLVIWRGTIWSVARNPLGEFRAYTGPSSHEDHLHVELNEDGAADQEAAALVLDDAPSRSGGGVVMAAVGISIAVVGAFALWRFETSKI